MKTERLGGAVRRSQTSVPGRSWGRAQPRSVLRASTLHEACRDRPPTDHRRGGFRPASHAETAP